MSDNDDDIDSGTVTESAIGFFDFAICTICAWLVPLLISRQRLYHRTLKRSPNWIREQVPEGEAKALQSVTRSMLVALAISITVYTITAMTLALLTRNLDNRTSYILVGLSHFVSSVFIFLLSYSAPRWLGVYSSVYSKGRRIPLAANLKALCCKVRLHMYRTFIKVYPLMIPFFMGAKPYTIPISVFVGIAVGLCLCVAIDVGNRQIHDKYNMKKFALLVAFVFIVASGLMFSYGCRYVREVWGDKSHPDSYLLEVLSFFLWVLVGLLLHAAVYKVSRDVRKKLPKEEVHEYRRKRTFFGSSVFVSARTMSRLFSKRQLISQLSSRRGGLSARSAENNDDEELGPSQHKRQTAVLHMTTIQEGEDADPSQTSSRDEDKDILKESQQPSEAHFDDEGEPARASEDTAQTTPATTELNEGGNRSMSLRDSENPQATKEETAEERKTKIASLQAMYNRGNSVNDIYERAVSVGTIRSSAYHSRLRDDDSDEEEEEPDEQDQLYSKCHLINVVCCDLTCGAGGREKPFVERASNCCQWTAWTFLLLVSLFLVVLFVGAQHQEEEVRSLLPRVHHILYSDMNTGWVCAYNDNYNATTIRERVEATQQSFPTPTEAHLAGYTILHCGACAACSNYPDLRQQYTTREILGQVALKCAKKTLFGGGYDELRECTMEKTGFEYDCATCWTTDYVCVKKNCIFISIRAFIINTVTNLQVGKDDITPSTCEEAMCEATEITGYVGFVPCSGASRRRMNIISSIKRPLDQQCRIVDVPDWTHFFGPSTGHGEFIEDWNATSLYPENEPRGGAAVAVGRHNTNGQ